MKIIEKRIEELIDYARNPRRNEQAVDSVAASLKEFGWRQPVVIDSDGVIVVGHTRVKAAKKLGMTKAPCLVADDLTPEQVKAYRILDNKIGEKSDWDYELLELELAEIKLDLSPFDVTFDGAVPSLLDEKEAHEDDFDPTSCDEQEAYIKLGDVIELGLHKVTCCDNADAVFDSCDMLLTDPPYGIDRDKGFPITRGFNGAGKKIPARVYSDNWDSVRPSQLAFDKMLNAAGTAFIFGGNFFADLLPPSTHWIFWDKEQTMPTFGDGELVWTSVDRKSVKKIVVTYNGLVGREAERFHPTQKPVKIIAEIITQYGENVKTILDPFLGSGTTLIAAEQLGRICYGTEISPKYCQVIIERYRKHCEKVGKPFDCKINGEVFAR